MSMVPKARMKAMGFSLSSLPSLPRRELPLTFGTPELGPPDSSDAGLLEVGENGEGAIGLLYLELEVGVLWLEDLTRA